MRTIKNIITAIVFDTFFKGAYTSCALISSLTKKDRKKSENYLVVPNNCVLSLSLSLSLRAGVNNLLYTYFVRARGAPYNSM